MDESDKELLRLLDQASARLFIGNQGAFYGSLVCTANIKFSKSISTACTNGTTITFNPDFFLKCSPDFRIFVLVHELKHIAYLHFPRRGDRDPKLWNMACDHVINHDCVADGYKYDEGFPFLMDPQYKGMLEEEIYNLLLQNQKDQQPDGPGSNVFSDDLGEPEEGIGEDSGLSPEQVKQQVANAVAKAMQAAKAVQGSIPGAVEQNFNKFIKSIVPWERHLEKHFIDLGSEDRTWMRPNRRYEDVYLPSLVQEYDRLTKVNMYIDVSGSIEDSHIVRFLSEMKYIKEAFNPEEMRIVQFDHIIQEDQLFTADQTIEDVVIIGRGGTSLEGVLQHIEDTRPTVSIIFSDLECVPMDRPSFPTDVIWLILGDWFKPTFGTSIVIEE